MVGVGDWGKNLMKKRNSKLKMENQKKGRKKRNIYNTSGDILIVKIFYWPHFSDFSGNWGEQAMQ